MSAARREYPAQAAQAVVTHHLREGPNGGGRIRVLDGCRALAILSVMAYHYTVRWAPPADPDAHLAPGALFANVEPLYYGWVGVELFFVISGFVILMTLENTSNGRDFVVRRFARIWPALIVATLITSAVVMAVGPSDWRVNAYDVIDSIVLVGPDIVQRVLHYDVRYVDGAYWSLWVEVRFYVLAVMVYYSTRGRFLAAWIGLLVVAFAMALWSPGALLDALLFPKYLPYFTLGMCLYKLRGGEQRKLASLGVVIAAGAILVGALSGNFDNGVPGVAIANERLALAGINLGIFVLLWLFLSDSPLVGLLAWRPVVRLGQASYSLYLLHQNLGVTVIRVGIGMGIPYLAMLPITIALAIGLALLMFEFVEKPTKRLLVGALSVRAPDPALARGHS